MLVLLSPRFWLGLALVSAMAVALGIAHRAGRATVRAEWDAEKLAISEASRLRERAAQINNERVDRDYQTAKARAADRQRATDDSLRNFTAAAAGAGADTSTGCGADGPDRVIADQCAVALGQLDSYAQGLAGKTAALQHYASQVCVAR